MKAEDLMIGDYCRVWREGLCIKNKGTIVKVLGIDAEKSLKEKGLVGCAHCHPLDGDQFDGGIWCEYLDPIPLTPEILEKNGFKKSIFRDIEGQHQWSWWRDTLTVVTLWMRELNDNPTDGWMIRIESTPAACCLKISSVHELQHCLKLCGIEKEIVLHD